ncbi:protein-disulfide reductase DsbD domain-containing protein [Rhizobium sp. AG855]|uniref:protein-disulfide reductase DsbD domain-containing protein n=1 Tax=Rhizobium sp. AG855 TaxID=2183898 RepID=UPI000E7606B9|nr:protein-disulfide reductase DsbD domain-containing protein [Rhizobium sp. AG855]
MIDSSTALHPLFRQAFRQDFRPAVRARLTGLAVLVPLCLVALTGTVQAASSAWATNEGGRMRLVLLAAKADGTREGVLLVEPKKGWITYWKEPGDVGIPPSITPAAGSDYTVADVDFPVPKLLSTGDMQDVGYDHSVALPLVLANAGSDRPFKLSAFVGVCQNICIPFQADLTVDPAAEIGSDPDETALVEKAKRLVPPGPSEDFRVTAHAMQPDLKSLQVSLRLPAGAPAPQVFVSGPSGHVYVEGTAATGPHGETLYTVPIGKLPKGYTMAGKRWGILVVAGERAMETTLAFE